MRAARLIALMDHLRAARRPVSARRLADAAGISERTAYRDIAALQAMGAPIRGEGGVGYVLERGHFLPPVGFTPDEIDAVALGMQLVAARGDPALAEAAERVLAKLEAVAPESARGALRHERLLARAVPSPAQAVLGPIRAAIRDRRKLRIGYRDLAERRSTRIVHPLGLTAFDAVWLLVAWCETKEDFRSFRVDRLEAVEPLREGFPVTRGRELGDFLAGL